MVPLRLIPVNAVLRKAYEPMLVSILGKLNDESDRQFRKAEFGIAVTPVP